MLSHPLRLRSVCREPRPRPNQLRRNFFRSFFSRGFFAGGIIAPQDAECRRASSRHDVLRDVLRIEDRVRTRIAAVKHAFVKSWSGRRGSNPRPRPWQGRALPLSYTRIRIGGDCAPATAELCQMQPPNATASAIPVWPAESAFNPETRLKTPLDRAKPRRSARERLLTSSADCKSGLQAPIRAGKC